MGVGQNAVIYLTRGGLQTLGTKYFCISLVVTTTTKKFLDLEAQNLWGQTMLEILIQKEATLQYQIRVQHGISIQVDQFLGYLYFYLILY